LPLNVLCALVEGLVCAQAIAVAKSKTDVTSQRRSGKWEGFGGMVCQGGSTAKAPAADASWALSL
jgi:hypothetical protein